jgi:putative ABC transport system permease protein
VPMTWHFSGRTELVHAARVLLARPAFSLVVVLTLGLGIGANAAIFSAVEALLLRPFPFHDPDQLVRISTMRGGEEGGLSVPEQDDLAGLTDVIEDIALYTDQGMYNASGFGEPEELPATITTHNLFRVLGVVPLIGSAYPAETDRTRRFELVISHGLWTRRFGQDPHIVGRTMTLDGAPGYTIHGVLPPGINFPPQSDLFRSAGIAADPDAYRRRDVRGRMGLARLQSGVTVGQARSRIEALGERLAREFPQTNAGLQFHVTPLRDLYVGDVRAYILLLFGAVMLVLVVACSNVVNLLLSRWIARDRESAIRVALGASRRRVIGEILTESLLLSMLGGLVGVFLAWLGVEIITGMVRARLPTWMTIQLDGATLLFLVVVSIVTGLAAGLVPALRSGDRHLHDALRDGGRGSSAGVRQQHLRNALVVAEVALAVVLLVGASLMVQSFAKLQRVDPGFELTNMLTFRVELGWRAYDSHAKVVAFNQQVLDGLRALPGVSAVALDSNLPLSGKAREPYEIAAQGQSLEERQANPFVHVHIVSAGYFEAMGIAIERGRAFEETDSDTGQQVAVISRGLAERLWPNQDPIGKSLTINWSAKNPPVTVVGVARDIRHQQLAATDLDVYRPFRQVWAGGSWFAVRTAGSDPKLLSQVETRIVTETDPNQSFFDVRTMEDRIASGIWQQQTAGTLFALFAFLALALASIGLYGVLSYLVTQQWREIGVRIALGAAPGQVQRMVVGRGVTLAAAGISLGLVLALPAVQALAPVLFEVRALDFWSFVAVPLALGVVALVACYIPARRATRIDPLVALRAERGVSIR